MSRKHGVKNAETMNIRMSTELLERIRAAKVPSGWGEEADSSFARFLIIMGLDEIEWMNEEKKSIRAKMEKSQERAATDKALGKEAVG